jgi:hypothetical protein
MPSVFALLEVAAIVVVCYVLPIVHILRSTRTPQNMRVWFVLAVLLMGPLGYLIWWMITSGRTSPAAVAAKLNDAGARADEGKTALLLTRSSFYGVLVNYKIYLDDRSAPVAQIRGRQSVTLQIDPGPHVLYVRVGGRWIENPFEAQTGAVLAFSLNAQAKTMLETGVEGWVSA